MYQTLTFWSRRMSYQRAASKSASSTIIVAPFTSGDTMPYDVPVTQPGSAVHQKTSSSWRSSARRPVIACATTAPCTWTAPFGLPVVPLVKCSSAGSSGRVWRTSNVVGDQPMSVLSSIVCSGISLSGSSCTISTCFSAGRSWRIGAIFFR